MSSGARQPDDPSQWGQISVEGSRMIDQLRQEVNELISDASTWIGAFKYEWDDAITCTPIVKKDYVGTLEDEDDDAEFRSQNCI